MVKVMTGIAGIRTTFSKQELDRSITHVQKKREGELLAEGRQLT